jgi:hypothetical protein
LFGLIGFPAAALAQTTPAAYPTPADDGQSIKVGAVLFYDYTVTQKPSSKDADGNTFTPSAFDVKRAYLNITGNVSRLIAFRITPDIARETGTGSSLNGSLAFRIKYAYAQLNLDQWTGPWTNTFVRLGIQQTPFIDLQENLYRYRFQGPVFIEREGAVSSADTGATFHSTLPGDFGDVHVGVYNGEGYTKPEVNDQKSFQVRGTIRPFARGASVARGLRLTAYYDADHYLKNAPRNRFATNVAFEHAHFNLSADYLKMTDQTSVNASEVKGSGWSAFLTPFLKEKGNGLEGLLRLDRYTPNSKNSAQERQRTIAGVAYWFPHVGGPATAALMLDFEQLKFAGFPSTIPANATQQRIAVHGLINF